MKLEEINKVVVKGTGYYKKGCKNLYRRTFNGLLTEKYFLELYTKLCSEKYQNVQLLGPLKKCVFYIKNWKYKTVSVDKNGFRVLK